MHRENDAQAIECGAEQLGKAKASRDKPSACTDEPDLLHLQAPRQATACTGEPPKEPGTMPVGRRRDVIPWTGARKNRRASTARAHTRPACACARETDMRVRMRGRDLLHSDSSFRHIPKQIHHNPELIFWLSFTTGAESRRFFFPLPRGFFS